MQDAGVAARHSLRVGNRDRGRHALVLDEWPALTSATWRKCVQPPLPALIPGTRERFAPAEPLLTLTALRELAG